MASLLCSPGDADTAASFARQLLGLGADPNLRSRWTNMRALHYAAYFDVPQLLRVVLQASQFGGERRGGRGQPISQYRSYIFVMLKGLRALGIYLFPVVNLLCCKFISWTHSSYI